MNPYSFSIDGFDSSQFEVHSIKGREGISRTYSFRIVVTADAMRAEDIERTALGQRAVLTWNVEHRVRAFYGVVAAVRVARLRESGRLEYRMHFVPRLWLLKRKRRSRIFQDLHVPDIVTRVLLEAGIGARWQLTRRYPERAYVTQYEETDYEFVTRLLAEAGIFFYFPQGAPVDGGFQVMASVVAAVGNVGVAVAGAVGASEVGGLISDAASALSPVLPGDTFIGCDDAVFYPPIGSDDAALLAATTAAALAPDAVDAVGDAFGGMPAGAEQAVEGASAIAGSVVGMLTDKDAPTLHYLQVLEGTVSQVDKVTHFDLGTRVRPTAAVFREYDPERPLTKLESEAISIAPFPQSGLEAFASVTTDVASVVGATAPGVAGEIGSAVATTAGFAINALESVLGAHAPPYLEVYDHHDPFLFPQWELPSDEAPKTLRHQRRRAAVGRGRGACPDLGAGHKFALLGHPIARLDQTYVVAMVEHRGRAHPDGERGRYLVYGNAFECVPASMPYLPPRPRRRSVQVTLTATVVGPQGEEVYVDARGQIKVQFHWDRDGQNDQGSSCWVRTMQAWGGPGWGAQFIPRIGMEVVVTFEGGDPDKPMVLGCLYNATHPPPFPLPGNNTRSGWKSRSIPENDLAGSNEISFEDAAGDERINIVAHRNLEVSVKNDMHSAINGGRFSEVARDDDSHVAGSHRLHVDGSSSVFHGAGGHLEVEGNYAEKITGDHVRRVESNVTDEIGGSVRTIVDGQRKETVTGHWTSEAESKFLLVVGSQNLPGHAEVQVRGTTVHTADGATTIESRESLTLICGDNRIEMTTEGIKIQANSLSLGGKSVKLEGDGPAIRLGERAEIVADEIKLYGKSSVLQLDTEATVKGNKVHLGSGAAPPSKNEKSDDPTKQKLKLRLSDELFEPYANKHYEVRSGGIKVEGTTGSEGEVDVDVPKDARVAQVDLWTEDFPTGARRTYSIDIDDIPASDTLPGIRVRLHNLGYFDGALEGDELDAGLVVALLAFQRDHQLEPTGTPDPQTVSTIVARHRN